MLKPFVIAMFALLLACSACSKDDGSAAAKSGATAPPSAVTVASTGLASPIATPTASRGGQPLPEDAPPREQVPASVLDAYDGYVKAHADWLNAKEKLATLQRASTVAAKKARAAGDRYEKDQMNYMAYNRVYMKSMDATGQYQDAYDVLTRMAFRMGQAQKRFQALMLAPTPAG